MNIVVFWDIKTQFVSHRRHYISATEPSQLKSEVFTAVTMKNTGLWGVTPFGSCKNPRFGGTSRHRHQDDKIDELGTTLAVTSSRSTQCATRR
jgi:hypothetical protein